MRDSRAGYIQSMEVLRTAKACGVYTKSSIMLGLGETDDEIIDTMLDLKVSLGSWHAVIPGIPLCLQLFDMEGSTRDCTRDCTCLPSANAAKVQRQQFLQSRIVQFALQKLHDRNFHIIKFYSQCWTGTLASPADNAVCTCAAVAVEHVIAGHRRLAWIY